MVLLAYLYGNTMDSGQTPEVRRKTLHALDILAIFLENGFCETFITMINHLRVTTPIHAYLLKQGLILLHFGD